MNLALKSFSYLLHPVLMPLLGAIIYFTNTPRFIPENIVLSKIIGLLILTVFVPIVLFFFLKNAGVIPERTQPEYIRPKIPLLVEALLLFVIIKIVIDIYNYPELYFFFLGILFSTLSAIFIILFNIRVSIHMIGISAVTLFTITLSIHFGINLTLLIGILCIANGMVATARLHSRTQDNLSLILGVLLGILPQLTLISFWL